MSIVKKGIELHTDYNFTHQLQIPQVSDIFTCGNYMLFKCFDYEMPLCLKAGQDEVWEGQDLPR
jgi:hypothetical protein